MQALKAADLNFGTAAAKNESAEINADNRQRSDEHLQQAQALCEAVLVTLKAQSDGWKCRSLFERQWVIRDFKKTAGMPVEEWLMLLEGLKTDLAGNGAVSLPPLEKLAGYYNHLAELAKGYEKNPAKLEENLRHVYSWRDEVGQLEKLLE